MAGNRKFVIGNWKMNPQTEEEALKLAREITGGMRDVRLRRLADRVEVGVAPPFVFLEEVAGVIGGRDGGNKKVFLGAQDVFWENPPVGGGAHTGEISAEELKSVGVDFVIIGHSERREMGETDEEINRKVRKTLNEGLIAVLCVGEKKEMRNKGVDTAKSFVSGELEKDLEKSGTVLRRHPENLVIAYEPLWAISSGEDSEAASPEKVAEMISFIKKFLGINGIGEAGGTRVLYGGSVDSGNAGDFFERKEVDGALVGAASLEAEEFLKIVELAGS
jgi:triosephosphate isomerase